MLTHSLCYALIINVGIIHIISLHNYCIVRKSNMKWEITLIKTNQITPTLLGYLKLHKRQTEIIHSIVFFIHDIPFSHSVDEKVKKFFIQVFFIHNDIFFVLYTYAYKYICIYYFFPSFMCINTITPLFEFKSTVTIKW